MRWLTTVVMSLPELYLAMSRTLLRWSVSVYWTQYAFRVSASAGVRFTLGTLLLDPQHQPSLTCLLLSSNHDYIHKYGVL
jgi:hypothetical protein